MFQLSYTQSLAGAVPCFPLTRVGNRASSIYIQLRYPAVIQLLRARVEFHAAMVWEASEHALIFTWYWLCADR